MAGLSMLQDIADDLAAAGFDFDDFGAALLIYDPRPGRQLDALSVGALGTLRSDTPDHPALPLVRKHIDEEPGNG